MSLINNTWSTDITVGERTYHVEEAYINQIPDNFGIRSGDRIPFIACFTGKNFLSLDSMVSQFGRTVPVQALVQLFISGCGIVKVRIRRRAYLVGKGILMDESYKILAMVTVTRDFYYRFSQRAQIQWEELVKDFTLVINKDFIVKPEHKSVYNRFRQLMNDAPYNILTTWLPEDGSFISRRFPIFRTIDDRNKYTQELANEAIQKVLIEQVI